MPSITWPQTVYCPLRKLQSVKQMKNWLLAELGFWARAMEAGAAHMRLGGELGRQVGLGRAAGAGAGGIAALRHEAVDHPVEDVPS